MARHGRSYSTALQSPIGRLVALAFVGGIGCFAVTGGPVGTAGVTPAAASVTVRAERAGLHVGGHHRPRHTPRPGEPSAPAGHRPARASAAHRAPSHHAARGRWLPTGTGMWIHQWRHTAGGSATAVVHRAERFGLSSLYVNTGSVFTGFDGGSLLRRLLPVAHRAGIKVVAWDFPTLSHPAKDAHRLAEAAWFVSRGQRVDAVAPDIETASEGTHLSAARVSAYLRALRARLPHGVAVLATVPWPSSSRRSFYPYATVARHADALVPMAYWYNNSPAAVTTASVRFLRRFHKPVMPVGQGYDSHLDVRWLPHSNQPKEIRGFFSAATRLHVPAISLWSWQTAGHAQWSALAHHRHAFHR